MARARFITSVFRNLAYCLQMAILSLLLVIGVVDQTFAAGACPSPCVQAKANLEAIRKAVEQERNFLVKFEKNITNALNRINYKRIRNAYIRKIANEMENFSGTEKFGRLGTAEKIRWKKSYQLKARKDMLALRGIIRNLQQARYRARQYGKSLDSLERVVLSRAEKIAAGCKGNGPAAHRAANEIQRLMQKARRWLCWRRRNLLHGYEYAGMEAGFSPLGFGTVEQVAIHTRSRTLHGLLNDAGWMFGGANRNFWKAAGMDAEATAIRKALDGLQKVLFKRFGRSTPKECGIPKIRPLPKGKGKSCLRERNVAAADMSPGGREIVVRDRAGCVGMVVRRFKVPSGFLFPRERPEKDRKPPMREPVGKVTFSPDREKGKRGPAPTEHQPAKDQERAEEPFDLDTFMTSLRKSMKEMDKLFGEINELFKETPKREGKGTPAPAEHQSVEKKKKDEAPFYHDPIIDRIIEGMRLLEASRKGVPEKQPPELGLVKAKKKVVDLIVRNGDTGKPLSEATIRIVEVSPPLPGKDETVFQDDIALAIVDLLTPEKGEPPSLSPLTVEAIFDLEHAVAASSAPDRISREELGKIAEQIWKSHGLGRQKMPDLVERIWRIARRIQREHYREQAHGGQADKQGKVRMSFFPPRIPPDFELPPEMRPQVVKLDYRPRRQKVVLLPGNVGKKAVRRMAEVGRVKELPVMKHPRTGKPVKPVVVEIPDNPEAEKKLRDAARKVGGRDVAILDDPCLDKEGNGAKADFVPNDPLYAGKGAWGQNFPNQWAIRRIGLTSDGRSAWAVQPQGGKYRHPVVAIIDSGLDWQHPDIDRRRLWRNPGEIPDNGIDDDGNGYVDDVIGWNFVEDNNLPWDQDGHGTFVAGIIGAATGNGYGIAGINPDARLMILKALGTFGRGYGSAVARAVLYAADNGADIINLSLGTHSYTPLLHMAINRARKKGIIIVVAAGNQARRTGGHFPAGLPGVITVTATDRQDRRAPFSNWGSHVDIAAPGVDVLSLRARGTDLLAFIPGVKYELGKGVVEPDGAFYRASGTSFAAPMVSGTLSLVLSRRPEVSRTQAVRMILQSARDIEIPGFDNFTGYGLLDAAAALRADPRHFVEARISAVRVVRDRRGMFVQVRGRAMADRLKGARLYVGRGSSPTRWRPVGRSLRRSTRDGILGRVPIRVLAESPRWVLRLVVTHADGEQREARFSLRLK